MGVRPGRIPNRSASPCPVGGHGSTRTGHARATKASARRGGGHVAGGFATPCWQGAARRCGRGDGPCQKDRASRIAQERPSGRGQETRPAFPRPRATLPCRPAGPGTTKGQRPIRRARSARRGRVGRWPGALAPGWSGISVALWQGRWPLPLQRCSPASTPGGSGNATRVSPPARDGALQTGRSRHPDRPAPDPAGAKRPPWAGRALAGGFGPRLAKGQRGAVAGAMAPAIAAVKALSSLRAGTGNATRVSPARARRCPADRQVREQQKASVRRGRVGYWLGGPGSRQACGTRSAGPGRWPRPDRVRRGPKWVLPSGRQPMRPARSQQPAKAAPARRPAGVSRAAAVAKRWTGTAPGVTGRGRKARPAFPPPGAEPPVLPVPGISQHRQPGFLARTLRQVAVCPGPQGSGKAGQGSRM